MVPAPAARLRHRCLYGGHKPRRGHGATFVPWLATTYGWRTAFVATGLVGLLWIAVWLPIYRRPEQHPKVGAAELDLIQSDREEEGPKIRWAALVPHRQTWAIALVKFLTDPIWWFYLFWSGKIIQERFHVDLKGLGLPLIVIYVLADVGSIFGGWFSSMLIKRGSSVNAARKIAMLFCALAVLPVIYVPVTNSMWTAVLLIGLAAACHQGFAANVFTLASDMFPRQAVGSVTGLGGMAGALGASSSRWPWAASRPPPAATSSSSSSPRPSTWSPWPSCR